MTNRSLIIIIVVILLAGAAAAGYFYWQQTKPLVVSDNSQSADQQPANQPNQTLPTNPTSSSTPQTSMTCERNFDQNQLTKNSNLNIKNREVTIDVKGFGKIVVELYDQDAPQTVSNFLRLTDAGFYNCVTFHRVAKGFVIQGGDPSGTGTGGLTATGKALPDELNPNAASFKTGYVAGVLAMANTGAANSGSSQFFITLADLNSALTHTYTIFGKVVSGMDIVQKIGQVPITPVSGPNDGSPNSPVVMQSVTITK